MIFGQQILYMWFSNCLVGLWKTYLKREINVSHSMLYIWGISSCFYCPNWESLIWLFVTRFSVFIGGSLVSSLIIVELFFFYLDGPWFLLLYWEILHVKQIVSLFSIISILRFILYWCSSHIFASLGGIYFCCLLLYYRVCYCVALFFPWESVSK